MTTAVFDTLKAFSKLEAAGMETSQAKAVVDTLTEAFDDNVATKADIAEVKTEIANLKAEVFRALWIQGAGIVGIQLAIAGLLFAAIRFLGQPV